jgi:hypothetical protein
MSMETKPTTTIHHFAKKLVKSQIEALADCDYDCLLTIYPDRVERSADSYGDHLFDGDARETLCHIIGTRLDVSLTGWEEEGDVGCRNGVSQLERLAEAVGLARWEVA